MKKMFRTYSAFIRAGIQDAIAYRASFLGFFIGEIFYCFIMYFLWKAVFNSNGASAIFNFTMVDMTVYLFMSNITGFLIGSDSTTAIGEEIKDGSIVMRMIKPINVDMSLFSFEIGNKIILASTVFLPVIIGVEIYKYIQYGHIAFNVMLFLLYVVSAILSYLLMFYFNLAFGYLAFFLMNLWGFSILKESIVKFFSGAIIPIAFFPWESVRKVFSVLPFASMNYTPVMIYMGKYTGTTLIFSIMLQIIWVLSFWGICKFIWKLACKYLCIQGG